MLAIRPLTAARWKDLETLFGKRGACGGCWCMFWRLARAAFVKQKGDGNRRAFKRLVRKGAEPRLGRGERVNPGWVQTLNAFW